VADRDIADAGVTQISADRRFVIAYNAALALATIVLHAGGYRAVGVGHHWATFQALPEIMGSQAQARTDYLDNCRSRRNVIDYDRAGEISEEEAAEILAEAKTFRPHVMGWLRRNHPTFLRE
jgi:hypothetical protein